MEFPQAKIILDRSRASKEEWLALHDQHIGASDAGAIMGLSSYQTPLSTYMTKKGLRSHKEETDFMRWGNLLEDLIRREFSKDFAEKEENKTVHVFECLCMYESGENPFMCVDPDGFVTLENNGIEEHGLLEIKTTTSRQKKYWQDDSVPDSYYAQAQHSMYVLGLPFTLMVCLMDKSLIWRYVPRKEGFIQEMIKIEKHFWEEFMQKDKMPGPSGQEIDTDLLLDYFPRQEDVTVDLGSSGEVERYLQLKEEIEIRKKEQELMKQQIITKMGVAYRAVAGPHKVTRVTYERPVFEEGRLRIEHPRLYQRYLGTTTVDFPRIS